mgnify:CR=1 FL=1
MLRLGIAGIGAIAGDYIGLIVGGKVRDVALTALCSRNEAHIREAAQRHGLQAAAFTAVSYTHLTLPTIYSV